ncbi:Lrp/AsnC family transcriptional regulator [Halomonas cibimaris]|uniref:siroheme decarboxylase n=1 Tax=Halomonas cibimaris TaxID=657012 RepID=A0ABP7LJ06_9GAMM
MSPHDAQAQRRLQSLLEQGLPLTPRPWRTLADQAGMTEADAMACARRWQDDGLIKRMGLVVRHRRLGMAANAMVVWDIADDRVGEVGRALAAEPAVTLCYRRPRRLPDWPYNLFCMIHGVRRARVLAELAAIIARQGLDDVAHQVLFSHHAYRQRGARYIDHTGQAEETR